MRGMYGLRRLPRPGQIHGALIVLPIAMPTRREIPIVRRMPTVKLMHGTTRSSFGDMPISTDTHGPQAVGVTPVHGPMRMHGFQVALIRPTPTPTRMHMPRQIQDSPTGGAMLLDSGISKITVY